LSSGLGSTVPVTVLTGFLGSGKTTLLAACIEGGGLANTAVLVNEFGDIPLDHHLLEVVHEDVVVLPSGCVCCAVRNDLVRALCDLHNRSQRRELPPLRRVVIETSGLANPTPLLRTLRKNALVQVGFHMAGTVTCVDATLGLATLLRHDEAVSQVVVAERLIITKTDLTTPDQLASLEARLKQLNPLATITRSAQGHWDGLGAFLEVEREKQEPASCSHEHEAEGHQGEAIWTLSETSRAKVHFDAFALWLSMMTQLYGENLLRTKGILLVDDAPEPVVVQSVQHVVYPVATLRDWPFPEPESRFVVIARGLEPLLQKEIRLSLRTLLLGQA
jgi:G3E family GTPase